MGCFIFGSNFVGCVCHALRGVFVGYVCYSPAWEILYGFYLILTFKYFYLFKDFERI